jgi:hypothetical protein
MNKNQHMWLDLDAAERFLSTCDLEEGVTEAQREEVLALIREVRSTPQPRKRRVRRRMRP